MIVQPCTNGLIEDRVLSQFTGFPRVIIALGYSLCRFRGTCRRDFAGEQRPFNLLWDIVSRGMLNLGMLLAWRSRIEGTSD